MDYAVIDCETTGWVTCDTDPQEPIELAALRVTPDFDVIGRFYRRWVPTLPVRPKAADVNWYTPDAWVGYDPICNADMSSFAEFIEGAKWVGSFPDYDFRILDTARRAVGGPPWRLGTHRKTDVGTLGEPLLKARGSAKGGLDAIVAELAAVGMPVPPIPPDLAAIAGGRFGPHTAMGDAWRTLHALRCLMQPAVTHWRAR